jgi:hypothetical protein
MQGWPVTISFAGASWTRYVAPPGRSMTPRVDRIAGGIAERLPVSVQAAVKIGGYCAGWFHSQSDFGPPVAVKGMIGENK